MQDFRKIYHFRSFSMKKWLQIIRIMTNLNIEKWDHWPTVFTFVNVLLSTNTLRVLLKPVVHKFHGNTENYYSNFCGLLQENLLPKTKRCFVWGTCEIDSFPVRKMHICYWNTQKFRGTFRGFDVKASHTSRPVSRLISWYNSQVIQQKNFDKRVFIQFHGTFHGFKITNWFLSKRYKAITVCWCKHLL